MRQNSFALSSVVRAPRYIPAHLHQAYPRQLPKLDGGSQGTLAKCCIRKLLEVRQVQADKV